MMKHNKAMRVLDLSKTVIGNKEIIYLLKQKTNLESINFNGCHGAPRGWRRTVESNEFKDLIKACEN